MASYTTKVEKNDELGVAPEYAKDFAHHEKHNAHADTWHFRNPFPSFHRLLNGPTSPRLFWQFAE
jgi:hypothetical protein